MMRREGFELMVSRPTIVTKRVDGDLMEPSEILTIDIPENFVGTVIERLGPRKGEMVKMANHGSGRVRMEFKVPSRGLIGLRNEMLTETRGTIVMNSIAGEYIPYQGEIPQRPSGALISDRQGAPPPTRSMACRSAASSSSATVSRSTRACSSASTRATTISTSTPSAKRSSPTCAPPARTTRSASSLQSPHPRAVHRVHRRRRARRGHPEEPAHAQKSPRLEPPPQGQPRRQRPRVTSPTAFIGKHRRKREPAMVFLCQ